MEIKNINNNSTMKDLGQTIQSLIDNVNDIQKNMTGLEEDLLSGKKSVGKSKDALLFDGKESSEFVKFSDVISCDTQEITVDGNELILKYSSADGINKDVKVSNDVLVSMEIDENKSTMAIPSSIVVFTVENKAEIKFKDVTFVDGVAVPSMEESTYKMLVELAKIGSSWYIRKIDTIKNE